MAATYPDIDVARVESHRNGVSGASFYAVTFIHRDEDEIRWMLATVFPPRSNDGEVDWTDLSEPRVAVFDLDQLPLIAFGENSWRGDVFAPALYRAIEEYEAVRA
jgi:hypothetical protein